MHFPDLGSSTQIDVGEHVRAIGWLSGSEPFSQGDVSEDFAERLRSLCASWSQATVQLFWPVAGGGHDCELCGDFRAGGNLGVPSGPLLFVAPQMVSHYVDVHRYRPPDAFIEAVLACPLPGTLQYEKAVAVFREINLRRYGGRDA